MALFDASSFSPATFQGILGLLRQYGLGNVPQAPSPPDQTPTGPTFARGNFGSMGGVAFPITPGQDTTTDLSAQTQQAQPPQAPASNGLPSYNPVSVGGLQASLSPAWTGIRMQQQQQAIGMQNANAVYKSLLASGWNQPAAIAAATNPSIMAELLKPQVLQAGADLATGMPITNGGGQDAGGGNILAKNSKGLFDDNTLNYLADQLNSGNINVLSNLGRTAMGAMNIAAVRQRAVERAQAAGVSPATQAAKNAEYNGYQTAVNTLGTRLGNVTLAINETKNLVPQAISASAAVPRTQIMPVNKMIEAYQENTGDPNIVKLGAALYGIVHTYAKGVNPQGVAAEGDINHATEILDKALSHGQLSAGIGQLLNEMNAIQKSPAASREELRQNFVSGVEGKPAPAAHNLSPGTIVRQNGVRYQIQQDGSAKAL